MCKSSHFTDLCVTLVGPFQVRAYPKFCPVVFCLMGTRALDMRLSYKQGSDAFLTTWIIFCAVI